MKLINIGSLHVPLDWIFITISFVISTIIWKIFLRKASLNDKTIMEHLWNGVFIFILVWKFSLIIFEPILIIQSPLSLLYFTGGDKGTWLGIAIAILYIIKKLIKQNFPLIIITKILFIFGLTIFAFFNLIFIYIMESVLFHIISGVSALIISIIIMGTFSITSIEQTSTYIVIFAIIQLLLSYINKDYSINQLIFSTSQWVFIGIGVIGYLVQFVKREKF